VNDRTTPVVDFSLWRLYALLRNSGESCGPMSAANMNHRWMTLPEVAEYLQVSKDLIYRLAQKGKIPASKVGNQWRFKKEKIDLWVETQQVQMSGHQE